MKTFTKYHLAIPRDRYLALRGMRGDAIGNADGLLSLEEIKPDYDSFCALIDRVGSPWGWTRRPRYIAQSSQEIFSLLGKQDTRLFVLCRHKKVIGYCLAVVPKLEAGLADKLSFDREPASRARIVEIENFGLFPEHTGKGYGQYFLPAVFEKLLVEAEYDTVYLSTRSTNHARVVPFYENLGMSIVHRERLRNDLVPVRSSAPDVAVYGT